MGDFSFERQFCHFNMTFSILLFSLLTENSRMEKVMLKCNIDCCPSIYNDKISISLYYNDPRLDVEN